MGGAGQSNNRAFSAQRVCIAFYNYCDEQNIEGWVTSKISYEVDYFLSAIYVCEFIHIIYILKTAIFWNACGFYYFLLTERIVLKKTKI